MIFNKHCFTFYVVLSLKLCDNKLSYISVPTLRTMDPWGGGVQSYEGVQENRSMAVVPNSQNSETHVVTNALVGTA